jgi:hypothetical protein
MKSGLNAQKLRYVLLAGLVILVGAGISAFTYTYSLLKSYTAETSALNAQANLSDSNIESLKRIKQYLAENSQNIKNARDIVAESRQYMYQNSIVEDISSYAAASGITITSYSFVPASGGTTSSASSAQSPGAPPVVSSVNGVKTTTANFVIKSPVPYDKLLDFIRRIERSPMKMQIGSISLTKADGDKNQRSVTTQGFTVEVYIR